MPATFYILASGRNGTLYHGSTNDLSKRVWEHKNKLTPGFTSRYGVTKLVYCEHYDRLLDARARESLAAGVEAQTDRGPRLARSL
jgi:putative endonuclease